MEYSKPELIPMGKANDAIQVGLVKGPHEWDSIEGPPSLTSAPAYQADE
jgi:hypothetical protein